MNDRWITLPRKEGATTRQAHADLPSGSYERELGREGFFGPATQMHHRHPPTGWTEVRGPLRPRAFDLHGLDAESRCPWDAPEAFSNDFVRVGFWQVDEAMDGLARNADGDELLFVHSGSGSLFCDYGHLAITEGDYVLLPRGTMWRISPTERLAVLRIEATNDALRLPDRGMLGQHAVFDTAALDTPELDEPFRNQPDWPTHVRVKRRGDVSTIVYPFNPLDAVGWQGSLCPVRLNWRDIRPVMSHRLHLPPSVHTTFVTGRFVICTFCPRPIETDPGALKVPFYHSNDDYDELIFYHRGEFFSRDRIEPGMSTLHPSGIPHGPHPKAFETATRFARKETDEVAVMIDTRDALLPSRGIESVEWEDYVHSWSG